MIRIIIDTNIALAGFLSYTSIERQIINHALKRNISLVGSIDTYNEFSRKLDENPRFKKVAKDFMFPKSKLLSSYKSIVRFTQIEEELQVKTFCSDDSDDDVFIRAALASSTKIIVTRDKHLLKLSPIEDVRIVIPEVFLEILKKYFP